MGLVTTGSVSEAMPRRDTRRKVNPETHEGNNHKRVCIACSNLNHRTFVCAGPRWQPPSHGCGGKRVLVVGTNSMWRRCEWDKWLWPPHDQRRILFAPEPQRATVKRGPQIMSLPGNIRELSFDLKKKRTSYQAMTKLKGANPND